MWPFSVDEATWRPHARPASDYLFSGGRVFQGASLVVQDGIVQGVGEPPVGAEVVPLRGRALLPGMVAAHSHAFQRAIRGRTEHRSRPTDEGSATRAKDDFWSWREAMYAAAERLTPQDLHAVSKFCFLEMARAGITAVGEFHYLHRDASGKPYADPNELDLAVARAAREVGLRIVLLRVAYARSGFRVPENPRQKRFIEGSAEEYLKNLDALSRHVAVGAAPHSVRACPAEWIRDISQEAFRRGWPLHLHVAEQRGEVEQCQAEHGTTPALLLERLGVLRDTTTAVHAVHLSERDIAALGRARATVCACPTTERNLGDGVVRADLLLAAGYGSASEATRRCSSRRSRTRASSSTPAPDAGAASDPRPRAGRCLRSGSQAVRRGQRGRHALLGAARGFASPRRPGGFHRHRSRRPVHRLRECRGSDGQRGVRDGAHGDPRDLGGGEPLRLDFEGALPGFRAAKRRLWG